MQAEEHPDVDTDSDLVSPTSPASPDAGDEPEEDHIGLLRKGKPDKHKKLRDKKPSHRTAKQAQQVLGAITGSASGRCLLAV